MDGPFYFNDSTFNMMRIDYTIPLNSVEVWKLVNETMVAHPFHIHDVQFFILDRNGIAPTPEEAGRKDVVFVLPGDTVRFITKFEDFADTVVPYMFHCHILMHEDDGMMGQFIVHPSAVGVEEIVKTENFRVYPNPLSGNTLNFEWTSTTQEKATISLYDLYGRLIISSSVNTRLGRNTIELPDLTTGTYFLSVKFNETLQNIKLIKQ